MNVRPDPYAQPDRADCVRQECRSPASCATVNRCADRLSKAEDLRAFGYGSGLYAGKSRKGPRK